ncbi:MAG: hypothetical protein ACOYMR_08850 [Ilumatobacteraceae bacterium]
MTTEPGDAHHLGLQHDPVVFLRGLAASMDATSTVIVRARNAASLDARLALLHGTDTWTADTGRPFTRQSLFATVQAAGLVVTSLERVPRAAAAPSGAMWTLVSDLVPLDPNAATEAFVATLQLPNAANAAIAEALAQTLTDEESAAAAQVRTLVEAHQREQAELLAGRQELIAVQNGKLMRWSQFPRRVYRRLRRLVGRG